MVFLTCVDLGETYRTNFVVVLWLGGAVTAAELVCVCVISVCDLLVTSVWWLTSVRSDSVYTQVSIASVGTDHNCASRSDKIKNKIVWCFAKV